MQPKYGKVIKTTTYSDDKVIAEKEALVLHLQVAGVMETLNAISIALKNIGHSDNHKMTFEVQADHTTFEPKLVVQTYQLGSKK